MLFGYNIKDHFYFTAVGLLVLAIVFYMRKSKRDIIIHDLQSKSFWIMLILIGIATYMASRETDPRYKYASREAFTAFVIGYFAHIDALLACYIFVWMINFYFTDRINEEKIDKVK